jgi:hypothetical protein
MALICSTPHQHFPADVLGQEPHLFSMRFATNELRTPSARAATSSCGVAGLVRVLSVSGVETHPNRFDALGSPEFYDSRTEHESITRK